jgi:hypothetical protein
MITHRSSPPADQPRRNAPQSHENRKGRYRRGEAPVGNAKDWRKSMAFG